MSWWVPALGAAFTAGVIVGTFIRWGLDRGELAAYRRISREAAEAARPDQAP